MGNDFKDNSFLFCIIVISTASWKKQLSQLTYFNYVTGITIGSIAADIAGEGETPFLMLREKNVFSKQDVHYAILEPNGQLSVLKKEYQQAVTKGDMNITTSTFTYLPSEIISDGKIVVKNLKELNLTKQWVLDELKKHGIQSVREVFYAEIQKDGSLYTNK